MVSEDQIWIFRVISEKIVQEQKRISKYCSSAFAVYEAAADTAAD